VVVLSRLALAAPTVAVLFSDPVIQRKLRGHVVDAIARPHMPSTGRRDICDR
jgi:hypothetical protein